MTMDRRELFMTGAAASAGLLIASTGIASAAPSKTGVATGKHEPLPLPFKASALTGISDKMIASHHDKNYAGAVKNLNKVEVELAALKPDAPGFVVAGLREKELTYFNSMVLHEQYFANLGGNGKRSGALEARLGKELGASAWEAQFRAAAMALGGGSGWVVLALSFHDGGLRVVGAGNHTQTLAFGAPLLVLDMYEHSYAIDYGADHAAYIDAFFKNVAWEPVEARYSRATKALSAL